MRISFTIPDEVAESIHDEYVELGNDRMTEARFSEVLGQMMRSYVIDSKKYIAEDMEDHK